MQSADPGFRHPPLAHRVSLSLFLSSILPLPRPELREKQERKGNQKIINKQRNKRRQSISCSLALSSARLCSLCPPPPETRRPFVLFCCSFPAFFFRLLFASFRLLSIITLALFRIHTRTHRTLSAFHSRPTRAPLSFSLRRSHTRLGQTSRTPPVIRAHTHTHAHSHTHSLMHKLAAGKPRGRERGQAAK